MNSSDLPVPPEKQQHSPARKATGWLLVPYLVGSLGAWYGFPLEWNAFGLKFVLIVALPVLALVKVPRAPLPENDEWRWRHFFGTLAYLVLASWLVFREPTLVGCSWGVCF